VRKLLSDGRGIREQTIPYKEDHLAVHAESGSGQKETRLKIRELESRLNHIMSDSDRVRIIRQIRDLKAVGTSAWQNAGPDSRILWTPDGAALPVGSEHEHTCARCGSHFSHESEETLCNEIHGEFYCDICYETAAEHTHGCPVCGEKWKHYGAPNCELEDLAQCFRHGQGNNPDAHGLENVAGMNHLKAQLYENVVAPLRNPEAFQSYGLGIPNGILLFGSPGCGKTHIARQLAEELGYFYQEVSPSDVGGTYIHETAQRTRELFEVAAKHAPSVLFIDEFEGLAPSRGGLRGDQVHTNEEVNELLKQIESCAKRRILLIAASNEPWKIDAAIQRTGRLDLKILVGPPDVRARTAMLRYHLHGRLVDPRIDVATLATTLVGYAASDLKFLVDQAARLAMKSHAQISTEHLWQAVKSVPASISSEDEERYERFKGRGAQ
jgi:AAA+ superfamily predicted ATPase